MSSNSWLVWLGPVCSSRIGENTFLDNWVHYATEEAEKKEGRV